MDLLNNSAKSLFVLYLMISSNYLGNLFGCRIQEALNTNMALKHLLGFLTLYFFVSLVDTTKYSPMLKLLFSFVIYLCFMMSTKMNSKTWIAFISVLGGVYILFTVRDSITDTKMQEYISYLQLVLVISAIIILLLGFVYYLGEKKIEYKDDFSFTKFFLGTQSCKFSTPEINKSVGEVMLESFK
ncbi:hypothetical protein QKU48_gp0839 [Fadolivirus algeromassiliense]|jgi:hypothetical protein|uniref:Uncharacterized protein n=1 Tax=Fadolivirus FV1/VV64 TaxID=3070911 RepID=A0A7D3V8Z7_9VIRU|nr:hypothetical protein QKU48_gp0839 [Fadolivirus algeromassiliense]QKF94297.1 hypothetical protein Fadolivirus_1_839 [Fadolivirus FV1/VV64]